MKSKVVSSVLAVVGIFALSATAAQAGGGEGATALNVFFECKSINGGANVGQVVSTHELLLGPGTGPVLTDNIKVGSAVLVCRQVDVVLAGEITPINGGLSSTDLKCYSVTTPGPQNVTLVEQLTDDFGEENVVVNQATRLLCGPVGRIIPE